jgi:outer membrane protein TolC
MTDREELQTIKAAVDEVKETLSKMASDVRLIRHALNRALMNQDHGKVIPFPVQAVEDEAPIVS